MRKGSKQQQTAPPPIPDDLALAFGRASRRLDAARGATWRARSDQEAHGRPHASPQISEAWREFGDARRLVVFAQELAKKYDWPFPGMLERECEEIWDDLRSIDLAET